MPFFEPGAGKGGNGRHIGEIARGGFAVPSLCVSVLGVIGSWGHILQIDNCRRCFDTALLVVLVLRDSVIVLGGVVRCLLAVKSCGLVIRCLKLKLLAFASNPENSYCD